MFYLLIECLLLSSTLIDSEICDVLGSDLRHWIRWLLVVGFVIDKFFIHSTLDSKVSSASSVLKFSIPLQFEAEYLNDELVGSMIDEAKLNFGWWSGRLIGRFLWGRATFTNLAAAMGINR